MLLLAIIAVAGIAIFYVMNNSADAAAASSTSGSGGSSGSGGGVPCVPYEPCVQTGCIPYQPCPQCYPAYCGITFQPSTWPSGDNIWNICQAIARQEGAAIQSSKPDRYNNPGDITDNPQGYSVDSEGLTIFPSKSEGWTALYNKWVNILSGNSSRYNPNSSWYSIGAVWATDPNWPIGVCRFLGVDPNSTPAQYVSGC